MMSPDWETAEGGPPPGAELSKDELLDVIMANHTVLRRLRRGVKAHPEIMDEDLDKELKKVRRQMKVNREILGTGGKNADDTGEEEGEGDLD
jgi:hypothetical protein